MNRSLKKNVFNFKVVAAEVVVIQAALQKKVAQSMVVIIIQQRNTRAKRDIILMPALTKAKREAAAKAIIRIITMKKAVTKVVVMTRLTNMDHITKAVRDRRVESMDRKRDTRRVPRPLDIITSPERMTTIRNTNSTMMLTRRAVTISMAAIMRITHPKEEKARKADITNLDIKETNSAKRATPPKVIMMKIIRDIRDTMDMKVISLIMTISERREDHQVVANMVSGKLFGITFCFDDRFNCYRLGFSSSGGHGGGGGGGGHGGGGGGGHGGKSRRIC